MAELTTEETIPDGAWDAFLTQYLSNERATAAGDGIPVSIRVFTLATLVNAFDDDELRSLVVEIGRQHAIMPIIDPTRYREAMVTMQVLETLAGQIIAMKQAITKAMRR